MNRERALASIAVSIGRMSELQRALAEAPALQAAVERLRQFQAARLAASYRDLADDGRYQSAVRFFLTDLYGPLRFEARDREFQRASRLLGRMLPLGPLETLVLALELQALTLDLDVSVARQMSAESPLSSAGYRRAYNACGQRPARERQIALVCDIARSLQHVVHQPNVEMLVRVAHLPARLAGFSTLQSFIERGFDAFRRLQDAGTFIKRIEHRETMFMNRLFANEEAPLVAGAATAATANAP